MFTSVIVILYTFFPYIFPYSCAIVLHDHKYNAGWWKVTLIGYFKLFCQDSSSACFHFHLKMWNEDPAQTSNCPCYSNHSPGLLRTCPITITPVQGREVCQMPVVYLYISEIILGWFFTLLQGCLYRTIQAQLEVPELTGWAAPSARNTGLLCPRWHFCVAIHSVHQTRNLVFLPANLIHVYYFHLGTLPKFTLY